VKQLTDEALFDAFCRFIGSEWCATSAFETSSENRVPQAFLGEVAFQSRFRADRGVPEPADLDVRQFHRAAEYVRGGPLRFATCMAPDTNPGPRTLVTTPQDLLAILQNRCAAVVDSSRPIARQLGDASNPIAGTLALVAGTEGAHWLYCRATDKESGRLICWDPLGIGSPVFGTVAPRIPASVLVPTGEFFWLVTPSELQGHLLALLLPIDH
jgi:hypothetical protein